MLSSNEQVTANRDLKAQANRDHLVEYMALTGITIPQSEFSQWRMVEPRQGHIIGIPNSRGTIRATNGILCYIDVDSSQQAQEPLETWERHVVTPFLGHYEWWQPDRRQSKSGGRFYQEKAKKLSTLKQLFEELEFQP